jgi:hypothetical protein
MKKLIFSPFAFIITQSAVASTPEAKDDASVYPVVLSVIVLFVVLLTRIFRKKMARS